MDGQISIFDFPEFLPDIEIKDPHEITKNIQHKIIDDVYQWTIANCKNWNEFPYEEQFKKVKTLNKYYGGGVPGENGYLWQCSEAGIDIKFDKPIGKTVSIHIGWPMFIKYVAKEKSAAVPFEECMNPPVEELKLEIKHPCERECNVEWCSIACFEKRGQIYDRVRREWCKDADGNPLVRDCKECDWTPKQTLLVSVKGMLDDGYCPKCNLCLEDLVEECPECHNKLDWTDWKRINEVE